MSLIFVILDICISTGMDVLIDRVQSVFSNSVTDESFPENLNELVRKVNNIQTSDINFNLDTLEVFNQDDAKDRCPPVTCIAVKETETFTMDIFILQKDSRIPLHDHPNMHGILKVIYGTVKITSYSPNLCDGNEVEVPEDIKNRVNSCNLKSLIPVEVKMSETITDNNPSCLLTPTEGNYHEIEAVGGASVIFDILAPPYGDRDCHFYSVLETNNPDSLCKIWLSKEIDEPSYWCE